VARKLDLLSSDSGQRYNIIAICGFVAVRAKMNFNQINIKKKREK
jgi:hypothetical protein